MIDKDALELLNMYTTAAQIAKSKNKYEYRLKMDESLLVEYLKQAFPSLHNNLNFSAIAKHILNTK